MWWPIRSPTADPWLDAAIDWDRTIAFREHLWDLGFGVAEAMDTAQRGMGMSWPESLELIRRSVAAAKPRNGVVFSGAGTDQLAPEDAKSIDDVIRAYEEQIAAIEKVGGRIILMASRALARVAKSGDDYAQGLWSHPVAGERAGDHPLARRHVRSGAGRLLGHQGPRCRDGRAVGDHQRHAAKVDGVKISLLDKDKEIAMRRRLADGVRMYTGDDFNYAELIAGDDQGYSDALLGIFDAIAPAASAALVALAKNDGKTFHDILAPTVPLSRHIFRSAHALLQDRRGVHGLSQRPSGSFHHDRRTGKRALDAASRRDFPACGCGRPAARSRARDRAHAGRARDAGRRNLI